MSDQSAGAPPITPIWIVAFSGHRPSEEAGRSLDELEKCRPVLRQVLERLQRKAGAARGEVHLLCSAAAGADLIAISVAGELDMDVHLMLPKAESRFLQDFAKWPGERKKAEDAISCAEREGASGTCRVATSDADSDGYYEANVQMLRIADVLVTIVKQEEVNPAVTPPHGSTAEMMELAPHMQKPPAIPLISIDPTEPGVIAVDNDWDLKGKSTDADGWLFKLNAILKGSDWTRGEAPDQRGGEEDLWLTHRKLDSVAYNSSSVFRNCLARVICLHFAATAVAALAVVFSEDLKGLHEDAKSWVCVGEMILVGIAFLCWWRASRADANSVWQDTRLGAEFLASQLRSACIVDPLYSPIMRYDQRWSGFAISVALRAHSQRDAQLNGLPPARGRFDELRAVYQEKRIRYQLKNYLRPKRDKAQSAGKAYEWVMFWAPIATGGALLTAFVLSKGDPADSLLGPGVHHWAKLIAVFLTIFIPLCGSLAGALEKAQAADRRSHRYGVGAERLELVDKLLDHATTPGELRRLVEEAEDVLLDDLIDWHTTVAVTKM